MVYLVGAGPGDKGLLTLKGADIIKNADVVIYDALVSLEILMLIPQNAEKINVGKRANNHIMTQEEINKLLLEKAKQEKIVVRLKGGDPFLFGRGGEELELLVKNNINFEIVSGITSAISVPAYSGIPVTHRDFVSSLHIITGHNKKNSDRNIDYDALVKLNGTLVFLMGVTQLENICKNLLSSGMESNMPACIIENGTTSNQRVVNGTISNLCERAKLENIKAPAIIIIGKVCEMYNYFQWKNKRKLDGKRILITRPKNQISQLETKLRKLGADVICLPTISIIELDNNNEFINILNQIEYDTEQWFVFTSANGVEIFFKKLKEEKLDLRYIFSKSKFIKFAVIGKATAKKLEEFGIFPDLMPDEFLSEKLAEKLINVVNNTTKVNIFRAKNASKTLTDILKINNINYIDFPLYDTIYNIQKDFVKIIEKQFNNNQIDYVMFTSASTVKGFVNMIKNINFSKITAICIGEVTKNEALKYNMNVLVAKEALIDSMIDLII